MADDHTADHRFLSNGIELGVLPLPARSLAAMEIRVFSGCAYDAPEHHGAAHVLAEVITKGTARRDGRGICDAFDEIGASHGAGAGRETITFSCLCLPDFLERAIELHAEIILTPTLPAEACTTAVHLARQSLAALADDPSELARKELHRRAYGHPLGRHPLGEFETLERIGRDALEAHWRRRFDLRNMQIAVAGAVEPAAVADAVEKAFDNAASSTSTPTDAVPRPDFRIDFRPGRFHRMKDFEQEQIAMCFPGAAATDADQAVERVLVGVLAGGMSSRLWDAVREKQGLVYWVGAWEDRPRNGGMLHLGASATPRNAVETRAILLRELDRLTGELTDEEIERAVTGLIASTQTYGDLTRAHAARLANDLFYHGRPVPLADKLRRIQAVTVDDIRRYLDDHPRDRLCVITVGPERPDDVTDDGMIIDDQQ